MYQLKRIESTPMYDPKYKIYTVVVEGEMVDVPEDLFNKLFKESEQEESSNKWDLLPEEMLDLANNCGDLLPTIKDYSKKMIKSFNSLNMPKSYVSNFIKENFRGSPLYKYIPDLESFLDEIYEEIEKEKK